MSSGTAKSMLLYPMLLPAFCGIAVAILLKSIVSPVVAVSSFVLITAHSARIEIKNH